MFLEVFWNLVDRNGFSKDWLSPKQPHGNIVAMQILMGGLMLQPCQPDFISARNAVLQADTNYYDSKHSCEIWKGFSKRGLGLNAKADEPFVNSFDAPAHCN